MSKRYITVLKLVKRAKDIVLQDQNLADKYYQALAKRIQARKKEPIPGEPEELPTILNFDGSVNDGLNLQTKIAYRYLRREFNTLKNLFKKSINQKTQQISNELSKIDDSQIDFPNPINTLADLFKKSNILKNLETVTQNLTLISEYQDEAVKVIGANDTYQALIEQKKSKGELAI